MAADTSGGSLIHTLQRLFPTSITASHSESDIPQLSHTLWPSTSYINAEQAEISHWLTSSHHIAALGEDNAKHAERLGSLNTHLSTRTTILGSKPSIADVALYASLAPLVKAWTPEERTGEHGYHHIVRYVDFVQNAPLLGLSLKEDEKISIDTKNLVFVHKPLDPKEEKERKKKEKAIASAATLSDQKPLTVGQGKPAKDDKSKTEKANDAAFHIKDSIREVVASNVSVPQQKKEKKEKVPKAPKAPSKEAQLSPCLIDLRVGHILKAVAHPNADSLYVSTIACGDPIGTDNTSEYEGQVVRTVCSGLNGLIPLEEMQNRKIVAVCNLKPVTMRGIKSAAMVLAASPRLTEGEINNHAGPVELVNPPEGTKAGDRIYFEGWQGEPEGVLNPKKKVWEMIQPGFTTTDDLGVAFDKSKVEQLQGDAETGKPALGKLIAASGGFCTVNSLRGGIVR